MNEPKGVPLRILLIEDNEDHAALVIRSMKDHRVANTITYLQDGEQALEYLFSKGKYQNRDEYPLPNLILLDLRLPKIDGTEVLKKVKESDELKHIPVVVLTSSRNQADVMRSYDHHVNSYLVKPIDFDKFNQMMEDLGYYWLGWNTHSDTDISTHEKE